MKISSSKEDIIITHALGSCLGITIYDPVAGIGGMLHVMLPQSSIDPQKAIMNPAMFVDTGVPKLFLESYKLGAKKNRLIVKVAGGASIKKEEENDFFQIGKRNILMLKKLLWKNGVVLQTCDVGGNHSRTMTLEIATGDITISTNGMKTKL
jgi:chemotaxis protein CheD